MVAHARAAHQNKRHGKHQRHTKHFLKVYTPYIPLLIIVVIGLVFSSYWQPRSQRRGVLAYATSMSINDLLQATNQQRLSNGASGLTRSSKLDQAAQAKANDMATRNYWSHNTPEGNPPWVFVDQAGYSYKMAGENLAYGFMTSSDTVAGWMNSPSHRENLLSSAFADVGFGYANSSDYQNSGPETIVVAMYGTALLDPAPSPAPVASIPPSSPATQKVAAAESSAQQQQTQSTPATEPPVSATQQSRQSTDKTQPVTSLAASLKEPATQRVSRLQTLTSDSVPWLASTVSVLGILAAAMFIVRHGLGLHKLLVRGERYVLHHMVFDATIISLIGLCYIVSQTAGFIR